MYCIYACVYYRIESSRCLRESTGVDDLQLTLGSSLYKYYMRLLITSYRELDELVSVLTALGVELYRVQCIQDNLEPWCWIVSCAPDPRLAFYLIKYSEDLCCISY